MVEDGLRCFGLLLLFAEWLLRAGKRLPNHIANKPDEKHWGAMGAR